MLRLTSMTSTQRDQLHDQLFRHERVEFDQRLAEVRGDQGARQDPEVELDDYGGVADDNSSNSGEHGEFTRNVCQILRNMGETELQETSRGLKLLSYCYRKVRHNGPEFGIGKLLMDFLDLFAQAVTRYHLSGRKGTGLEVPRTDTNLHGTEARRSSPAITIDTLGMGARNGGNPVEADEAKTKCHDGSADNDKDDLEEEDVKPVQVTKRTPEVDKDSDGTNEDSDSGYAEPAWSDARLPPDSQEGQEILQASPRSREENVKLTITTTKPFDQYDEDSDSGSADSEVSHARDNEEFDDLKASDTKEFEAILERHDKDVPVTDPTIEVDGDYKSPLESLLAEEGARRVAELGEALLALRLRKLNDLSRDFRMKKQAMATCRTIGVNSLVPAA